MFGEEEEWIVVSETIAIVIPPVPADDKKAWEEVSERLKLTGPRPVVFQELCDLLTARYPDVSSFSKHEIDHCVWSDGPLIRNFKFRAGVIRIRDRAEEVIPFVIETANALGLITFVWCDHTIYRVE